MTRRAQPCSMLLLATALLATAAVADDEKCGSPCGNPCGVPCVYASPPPPDYYPRPPVPGYTPTPSYTPTPAGRYNPTPPSGWSPRYTPTTYNTPPGTLYPQDPGFRANDAARRRAPCWRAVLFAASSAVAGGVQLALFL